MKLYRFFGLLLATLTVTFLLNTRFAVKGVVLPPLAKFLSPFTGFWQNAETKEGKLHYDEKIEGLNSGVIIKLDEQRIPHIFAKNEHDVYFAQGYITARDRLWQMELMARGAGGRLSEIFGERALERDRTMRRIGLPFAAKKAIKQLDTDTIARTILNAYSDG